MGDEGGEESRVSRQVLSTHWIMVRPHLGAPSSRDVFPGLPSYGNHSPFCSAQLFGSLEHSVPKQGDGSLDLSISMEGGRERLRNETPSGLSHWDT